MTTNTEPVPNESGYDETQPRDRNGDEHTPDEDAPRQSQNDPDAKPHPSS